MTAVFNTIIQNNIIYISSALAGLSLLLVVIAMGSNTKENPADNRGGTTWLWDNGLEKLYDAMFRGRDPVSIGKKFGLEYDKYMVSCAVIGRKPNMKKEAMLRVLAIVIVVSTMPFSLLLVNPLPLMIGVGAYYFMVMSAVHGTHNKAKQKRKVILSDLPRFTDILHSALVIGTPIEIALEITANNLPGQLSTEMREAIAVMKMGANSWQGALEEVAHKYEVDALSDFVLDLITSAKKGVSITDAVARKSAEIKQDGLLRAKDKAAKMSNSILLPVAIFKMLPLILLLIIPVAIQILKNF